MPSESGIICPIKGADFMFDIKTSIEAINLIKGIEELDLSETEYSKVINYLSKNFMEVERYLEDNYQLLYLLQKKMKEKNAPLQLYFKSKIIHKIMKNNLYDYFEILDRNFDFSNLEYKGAGSSNFTFFFEDKVLKIGDKRKTFDFPTFYRFNDLIVQKKFPMEKNNLYLEISPRGESIKLTEEDLLAINDDLKRANLVIGDSNFQDNFAIFPTEFNYSGFTDIDGTHEVLNIEQSKTYQKRKIKLIDLDYIYKEDDKLQTHISRL